MRFITIFATFFIATGNAQANIDELSPQEKLLQRFFSTSRHMAEVIPKRNLSNKEPLEVKLGFIISHIYDIKSNEEEIDLGIWISMQWKNELVNWNTSEYGIQKLEVAIEKMWIPKIYLVQNAIAKPLVPKNDMGTALIFNDGNTSLDFSIKIKLTCSMPACLFPADKHTCPMMFNSITYTEDFLKLAYNPKVDESYGVFSKHETGLWMIQRGEVKQISFGGSVRPGEESEKSSVLQTSLKLIRKPGYYWLTVIAPMVLICIVTVFSVLLPWESGERTSLLITCFLALIVYLDTILNSVPKTSDYVPAIVMVVVVVLIFTILQITFTALASYFAERAGRGKRLAAPQKKIFMFLSKIFCKHKKHESNVKSFEEIDYAGDEIEIERKFPSSVRRKISEDTNEYSVKEVPGAAKSGSRKITRMNSSFIGRHGNVHEKMQLEEFDNIEVTKEQRVNCLAGKDCRKACKIMDRISLSISIGFLIACPVFFHLMYEGKIATHCDQFNK